MPFVEVSGTRLHYRIRGRGEPLVLIIGLSADGPVWEDHVKVWEQYFTCYLVDNRGAGRSDAPAGPYTTAEMADDVAGLMDALEVGQARVVGISMGGAIAQQLALRHPAKVRSQILVSTWARCDDYSRDILRMFIKARAALSCEDFMALLHLWIFTPSYYNRHLSDLQRDRRLSSTYAYLQSQQGFEGQAEACLSHDTSKDLPCISQPTLITVGSADIFTPPTHARELHAGITGSRLSIFEGWGHAHHWEDLERFNRETTDWLVEN